MTSVIAPTMRVNGPLVPAVPIPLGTLTGASAPGSFSAGALFGFSLCETTGTAPATVQIINGNDIKGQVVMTVTLQPGQSTREFMAPYGVAFDSGIVVNVTSGSVITSIFILPV